MEHLKIEIEGVDPAIVEQARSLSVLRLIDFVTNLINYGDSEQGKKLRDYLNAHGWHLE